MNKKVSLLALCLLLCLSVLSGCGGVSDTGQDVVGRIALGSGTVGDSGSEPPEMSGPSGESDMQNGDEPFTEAPTEEELEKLNSEALNLLKSGEGRLLDWQWLNEETIVILISGSQQGAASAIAYDTKTGEAILLGEGYDEALDRVRSAQFLDRIEFYMGKSIMSVYRGDRMVDLVPQVDIESELLPYSNEGAGYGNLKFSSDETSYFYERYPTGVYFNDSHTSDAVIIVKKGEDEEFLIEYPFDVKVTPKTARWIPFSENLLVMAEVPEHGSDEQFIPTCLVYNSASRSKIAELYPENGLLMRDSAGDRIVYERQGEKSSLVVYSYLTGESSEISTLGAALGMRLSPSGERAAIMLNSGALLPVIYELPPLTAAEGQNKDTENSGGDENVASEAGDVAPEDSAGSN